MLLLVTWLAAAVPEPAVAARVGKSTIYLSQLDAGTPQEQDEQLYELVVSQTLEDFQRENHLEPTDAELDRYNAREIADLKNEQKEHAAEVKRLEAEKARAPTPALEQKLADARQTLEGDEIQLRTWASPNPAVRQEMRNMPRPFISWWKLNRELYRRFGGAVVFQQAGLEAQGAWLALLQKNEKAGTLKIPDPKRRERFWARATKIDGKPLSEKDPFDPPWWEKTPP